MTNRKTLLGTLVLLSLLIGCGDDDDIAKDAGADASDDASQPEAGKGGSGGKGGAGGSAGASGKGGEGGSSGEGGAGGEGGEGGAGGEGGSGATTYSVGGQVSGLLGDGLVLQNNAGNDLTIDESGAFTFSTKLDTDEDYAVTVKTQPSSPTQACTVAMGTGKVGTANVTNVQVNCATNKYTIGGAISGLTGSGLKLKNNGVDELSASGTSFTFATSLDSSANYAVTVSVQPSGQVCGVSSGSGTVASANVTNVAVACYSNPVLAVEPSFASAIASWANTGATSYTLKGTTDGTCDLTTTSCPGAVEVASATSPATIPNLTDGTVYYFQLVATGGGVTAYSNKTATRPNSHVPNGQVNALATITDVTYAGGAFNRVSVRTGAAVPVNKTTGFPSDLPNFPIVDGDVYSVAGDGTGGYYVGGAFSTVNGMGRAGLAHIKSDGTLDADWHPDVVGGIVFTIAVNGNTVYVAGGFTQVGGQNRAGLAAIGSDGMVSMTWNPNPTGGGVSAIAFWQTNVVVGGSFTNIASTAQLRLAMLNGTTGAIVAWAPNPDSTVSALAVDGDTVYAAGEFRNIGSVATPRDRLAAIYATGTDAGKVTTWDPGADNGVYQLAFANNTVYVAGSFANIGTTPRANIAAIGTDGTVKAWNPALQPSNGVSALVASADTVYVAGTFSTVNTTARNGVAALSVGDTAALTSWDPNPDNGITALALTGNSVVVAGQQRGIRGVERKHLLAFDATGKLTSWKPEADNNVNALAVAGTTVYVGGDFGTLGGMPRTNLGAVDTAGMLSNWNPSADGSVYALAVSSDTVYAGGSFANVNVGGAMPAARAGLAAFTLASATPNPGTRTTWNPGADGTVKALALNATEVYVGGDFTTLGGQTRNHIGAVGVASNTANGFDPNVNGANVTVNAIVATDDAIYAGGEFAGLGSGPTVRANFAALDLASGAALSFAPNPDGPVYALLLTGGRLYVAGDFGTVATAAPRGRYAVYGSLDTTQALETDPAYLRNFDLSVRALSAGAAGVILAGGEFTAVDGVFRSGYAVLAP